MSIIKTVELQNSWAQFRPCTNIHLGRFNCVLTPNVFAIRCQLLTLFGGKNKAVNQCNRRTADISVNMTIYQVSELQIFDLKMDTFTKLHFVTAMIHLLI